MSEVNCSGEETSELFHRLSNTSHICPNGFSLQIRFVSLICGSPHVSDPPPHTHTACGGEREWVSEWECWKKRKKKNNNQKNLSLTLSLLHTSTFTSSRLLPQQSSGLLCDTLSACSSAPFMKTHSDPRRPPSAAAELIKDPDITAKFRAGTCLNSAQSGCIMFVSWFV